MDDFVTKEMCIEKHDTTSRDCEQLRTQIREHEQKLQSTDVRFAELSGDVKHIKDRIDNGLSTTVNEIKNKMDEFIPLIRESHEWAVKFKQAVFFLAITSFCGGIVSLAFYLIRMFTEKHL